MRGSGGSGETQPAVSICHPLVRDYFEARLKELDSEIFRAAHGRLYGHYRYAGLPAAFREPVAYALLALAAAFPENVPALKDHASKGTIPPARKRPLARSCWRQIPARSLPRRRTLAGRSGTSP